MAEDSELGNPDADRPPEGADWIAAAAESFQRFQETHDIQALSKSAGILYGATQRMLVDPERVTLAAGIGEELLKVSADQTRPDVLDYAIGLLKQELSYIDPMLDPRGATLVAGGYATLLSERYYIAQRLDDLAAALDLYAANEGFMEAMPDMFEDRERAYFWWGYGRTHWAKASVAGQRAELESAADCLGRAVQALGPESAFGRQIRGDLALVQLKLAEGEDAG